MVTHLPGKVAKLLDWDDRFLLLFHWWDVHHFPHDCIIVCACHRCRIFISWIQFFYRGLLRWNLWYFNFLLVDGDLLLIVVLILQRLQLLLYFKPNYWLCYLRPVHWRKLEVDLFFELSLFALLFLWCQLQIWILYRAVLCFPYILYFNWPLILELATWSHRKHESRCAPGRGHTSTVEIDSPG